MSKNLDKHETSPRDFNAEVDDEPYAHKVVTHPSKTSLPAESQRHRFRKFISRALTFLSGYVLGFITLAVLSFLGCSFNFRTTAPSLSVSTVYEQVERAEDLTTSYYYYTDLVTYGSNRVLFGIDLIGSDYKQIYTYNGRVGLGIDLSEIKKDGAIEISNVTNKITINVPSLKIVSVEVSNFKDIDTHTNALIDSSNVAEFQNQNQVLQLAAIYRMMLNPGFVDQACENTEYALEGFIESLNGPGYTVEVNITKDSMSAEKAMKDYMQENHIELSESQRQALEARNDAIREMTESNSED